MNEIYRVTSQERGFYRIDDGEGEYFAEVSGRLRHEAASRLDYPVVGDLVQADLRDDRAIIERVLPRHSLLVRRMAGGEGEQVIAANLDHAVRVHGAEPGFQPAPAGKVPRHRLGERRHAGRAVDQGRPVRPG